MKIDHQAFLGEANSLLDGWSLDSPSILADALGGVFVYGLWNLPGLREFRGKMEDAFRLLNAALIDRLQVKESFVESATKPFYDNLIDVSLRDKHSRSNFWISEGHLHSHLLFFSLRSHETKQRISDRVEGLCEYIRTASKDLANANYEEIKEVQSNFILMLLQDGFIRDLVKCEQGTFDLSSFWLIAGLFHFTHSYKASELHRRRRTLDNRIFWKVAGEANSRWGSLELLALARHTLDSHWAYSWDNNDKKWRRGNSYSQCKFCEEDFEQIKDQPPPLWVTAKDALQSKSELGPLEQQIVLMGGPSVSTLSSSYGSTLLGEGHPLVGILKAFPLEKTSS